MVNISHLFYPTASQKCPPITSLRVPSGILMLCSSLSSILPGMHMTLSSSKVILICLTPVICTWLAGRIFSFLIASQVSSIDTALTLGCVRLRVGVLSILMLSWKLSVLESLLDKELTANFLVETCTKLDKLILAVMMDYCLNRVTAPLVVAN